MWTWPALIAAALMIGISKAGFGTGVAIMAPALVSVAIGPKLMLGVLLPVLMLGDCFSIVHYLKHFRKRVLYMLLPGCAAGVAAGMFVIGLFDRIPRGSEILGALIGLICIVFVTTQTRTVLGHPRAAEETECGEEPAPYRPARWQGVLAGTAAGVTSTLAHGAGPVVAMFLLPQKLDKRLYVGTTVWFFAACNLMKLGPYAWRGIVTAGTFAYLPWLAPAVLAGTLLGVWMRKRIPARAFSIVIYVLVLSAGVKLVVDAFR